jgi:DNA invertase Pin-like site-specific DNA recombinase
MPIDESLEAYNSDRKIYGYANVSPDSRDDALRLIASYDTEIPEENIYIDVHTGTECKHDKYGHLMHILMPGDLLYVKSIDSLGRNYDEIIKQWKYITNEKKADIVAIDTPILDTRNGKDMMNTLITEVLLVQLSYLSESQKINRKNRQAEGISKAKGTRFGKPSITLPDNFPEVYRRYKRKELTVSEAAELCNMARTTFYDNVKRYEKTMKP